MMTYENLIKNINILLADDDEDYLLMTYSFLKQLGYNVDKVTDGNQALEVLANKDYQIALLDYFMPGLTGEEVIKKIRETNQQLIIILQTGFSGQKPPIEMMKNLNIQNYFDKTEGIDKLNLELISAVKIYKQQNDIELSKYKQSAIGALISGIAQELKSELFAVSGSIELTNMLIKDPSTQVNKEELKKLNDIYLNNKNTLTNIDKILTSLIKQSSQDDDSVMEGNDVIDLIRLILRNEAKEKEIVLNTNISLRPNSYIKGNVNDVTFFVCEIVKKIMNYSKKGDIVSLSLTEDEANWLFCINSEKVFSLPNTFNYLIKMLITSVNDAQIRVEETEIIVSMKKI